MCGSFCIADTCIGFPQPPKLTLCHGACVHLTQCPRSTLCVAGLVCPCFSSPGWPLRCGASVDLFRLTAYILGRRGFLSFWLCREGCVRCPSLYASPLRAPLSRPLRRLCLPHHTRLPGPALCTARVVCAGWACMPRHSRSWEPAVCLGPQSPSC